MLKIFKILLYFTRIDTSYPLKFLIYISWDFDWLRKIQAISEDFTKILPIGSLENRSQ